MLEQIQSPTESTVLAATKGKSGKQGVFANLFKALAGKGIAGSAEGRIGKAGTIAVAVSPGGKPLVAAPSGGKPLGVRPQVGEAAEALKELAGKASARTGLKTGKHVSGAQEKSELIAADKTSSGTRIQDWNPLAAAAESVARTATVDIGKTKARSDSEETGLQGKQKAGESQGRHAGKHQAAARTMQEDEVKAGLTDRVTGKHQDKAPEIGLAQAPVKASGDMPAEGRAADKTSLHGAPTRVDPQTGKMNREAGESRPGTDVQTGESEVTMLAGKDKDRISAQVAPKSTVEQSTKLPNQAGALEQDILQQDADSVQRICEELAVMANRVAGKTDQSRAHGNDSRQGIQAAFQANHVQTSHAPMQQSQAGAAPQATDARVAQAAAAASEAGQQGGKDGTTGRESTDARLIGSAQNDARPQQVFDLQQQAAVRMNHPMRAMEAVQSIAHSAANGTTKLELQLEPAHLGKVHVTLQTDAAKQLQMHLTVESQMTRQVIEQHMPQLRAALEQQGLNLDNFTLSTGSQGQQHQQQQAREYAAAFTGRESAANSMDMPGSAPRQTPHAGSRLSIHI